MTLLHQGGYHCNDSNLSVIDMHITDLLLSLKFLEMVITLLLISSTHPLTCGRALLHKLSKHVHLIIK